MPRVRKLPEPKTGNPFVYKIEYTPWMRVKLVLGMILIFPIRMIFNIVLCTMILISVRLGAIGWKEGKHLKPWQQFLMLYIVPHIVRAWLFLSFGYYHITCKGKRATVKEAPIAIIAPHSNIMDSWMLSLFTWGSALSRRENEPLPILGTCLKSCEPIWVDRSGAKAVSTVQQMKDRIQSPGMWIPLVLFPEGTVHNTEAVIGFKTGAFLPGCPVQPIVFRYGQPAHGLWSHFGHKLPVIFLITMSQLYNAFEVEYLPVYNPSKEEKEDAHLYAINVRNVMAKALGKETTNFSLEDLRITQLFVDAGLPKDTGLIEFNLINNIFNVRVGPLKEMAARFIEMSTCKCARVGREEFLSYFCWPVSEHANLLFDEYNTCADDQDRMRYREYVVGNCDLVFNVPDAENIASVAFKVLSGGSERLSRASVLEYMTERGHAVSKDSVEALLYKISQHHDLNADGFSAFVESKADVKVLLHWLIHGTDSL